jgi:cell division protein FtsW
VGWSPHRSVRTAVVGLVLLLLLSGVVMLYSTSFAACSEYYLKRQAMWVGLGGLLATALAFADYRKLGRMALLLMGLVALALAYLALAHLLYKVPPARWLVEHLPLVGGPTKGGFRWLHLGPFSLQPSEFAKPILVLFLAEYYQSRARHVEEFKRGFLVPLVCCGVVIGLVFLGKNLSTTVITGSIMVVMMFVAGVRLRYLLLLAGVGIVLFSLVVRFSGEHQRRMTTYRDPEPLQQGEGYQLWHSQLALGSGGWFGRGFTQSRMKQYYLPEAHTDFIVAIVGEELGFAAVAALMLLYCLLGGSIFALASLAKTKGAILTCVGIGWTLAFQAFVNIGVVSGFGPTTGVTAPFLSYGGSSMLSCMAAVGLLLSVSRLSEQEALASELQEAGFGHSLDPPKVT